MKRVLTVFLVVLAASVTLFSCEMVESQHNHKYSKTWTITDAEHWRVATCEHSDLIVNKGEHQWDSGVTTKNATEEEEGVFTYTCTVCKFTKNESISRLPHTHKFDTDEWTFNDVCHWKKATCEHATLTSPAEDHLLNGNLCIICGYLADSIGLDYARLSDGTYEVVGMGSCTNANVVIPSTYKGAPVTSIATGAMSDIVKKVVIPSDVTTIKALAFAACTQLETVIFEENSSLTTIGDQAFYGNKALKSFTVPKTVTSIGEAVFHSCINLESISVEEGNTHYETIDGNLFTKGGGKLLQYAFSKDNTEYTIPSTVTEIGIGAFAENKYIEKVIFSEEITITRLPDDLFLRCSNIKEISIPENVTVLGNYTFGYCNNLEILNIPQNLQVIGEFAFTFCESLPHFDIPSTVRSIGANAFESCRLFERFDIPEGVTRIESNTMAGCINATVVTIPKSVRKIEEKAFHGSTALKEVIVAPDNSYYCSIDGNLYNKNVTKLIYYAVAKEESEFSVPSSVTVIDTYAFYACENLTSILLPQGLTTINDSAFLNCIKLKSIVLPSSITSIGKQAFRACKSLEEISLPLSVTVISEKLFLECSSLKSFVVHENIKTIELHAFQNLKIDGVTFINTEGWSRQFNDAGALSEHLEITKEELSDPVKAAELLTQEYCVSVWTHTPTQK